MVRYSVTESELMDAFRRAIDERSTHHGVMDHAEVEAVIVRTREIAYQCDETP